MYSETTGNDRITYDYIDLTLRVNMFCMNRNNL